MRRLLYLFLLFVLTRDLFQGQIHEQTKSLINRNDPLQIQH